MYTNFHLLSGHGFERLSQLFAATANINTPHTPINQGPQVSVANKSMFSHGCVPEAQCSQSDISSSVFPHGQCSTVTPNTRPPPGFPPLPLMESGKAPNQWDIDNLPRQPNLPSSPLVEDFADDIPDAILLQAESQALKNAQSHPCLDVADNLPAPSAQSWPPPLAEPLELSYPVNNFNPPAYSQDPGKSDREDVLAIAHR